MFELIKRSLIVCLITQLSFFTIAMGDEQNDEDEGDKVEFKLSRREKRELGRLVWHQSHRDTFQSNNKYMSRLSKKVQKGTLIGLELIVAAPTDMRIESRWGHAMMRFVDSESESGDDLVLGFVALLDSIKTEHVKGMVGGYPVFPVVKSLRMFNNQYVKNEDRPLDRHVMVTSDSLRTQVATKTLEMWEHFVKEDSRSYKNALTQYHRKALKRAKKRWGANAKIDEVKHGETDEVLGYLISDKNNEEDYETIAVRYAPVGHPDLGGYTFLSNNCAGALVRFIEMTGLPHRKNIGFAGRIPIKLPVYFDDSLLTPFPVRKGMGLEKLKQDLAKLFTLKKVEELNNEEAWPKNSAELIVAKYDLKGQMLIVDSLDTLVPDRVRDEMIATWPAIEARPSYNEIYRLDTFPAEVYKTCDDRACIDDLTDKALLVWSAEEIAKKKEKLLEYIKDLGVKKLKKIVHQDEDYLKHLDLWSNI